MIVYVALRNVLRRLKTTSIIGALLTVIISLFFLGNTLLDQTDQGLKRKYIENFTGNIVIKEKSALSFGLFGANTPAIGEYFPIPVLSDYNDVLNVVKTDKGSLEVLPILAGASAMDINGKRYKVPLFGVKGGDYFTFFPGIKILRGSPVTDSSEGVMITEARAREIGRDTGKRPQVGESLLLSMYGNGGFKIRELPLTGIFTYQASGRVLDEVVLVDAQSLRALNSVTLASFDNTTAGGAGGSPEVDEIDTLFLSDGPEQVKEDNSSQRITPDSVIESLSAPGAPAGPLFGGGWNFILVKTKKGVSAGRTIKELNRAFSAAGLNAEALDWRDGAGLTALFVLLLKFLYNGGFLLLLIAGTVTIVNVLLISVFERTGEIGTLRAFGAARGYIKALIYLENILISLFAALAALLLSYLIILAVNSASISLSNTLLISLFGERFSLSFSVKTALLSLIAAPVLGVIGASYPVRAACSIEPAAAMGKNI